MLEDVLASTSCLLVDLLPGQRLVKLLHDVIETALELNFSSVQALGSTVKSKSLCSAGRQARLSLNDQ